jgi:uncharacterized membrane protein
MEQSSVGQRLHTFTRQDFDLVMVAASALITLPLALLTTGPVRIAFAIPFIIFIPGYCLIAALYPRDDSLDTIERLALSFGTSIAVVPLIGLVLNYTPWGIRLVPILLSVTAFIVAACVAAAYRRSRLLPEERYSVRFTLPEVKWAGMPRTDRLLTAALLASVVFAVGTLVYVVATPRQGERFTEFYILGTGGMAEGYPTSLEVGEGAELIMGVVNHEGEQVEYTVQVRLDGDAGSATLAAAPATAEQSSPNALIIGPLEDEGKWEEPVAVTALAPGEQQKLEFLLFSPRPREGYVLRSLLAGDGYASIELHEAQGHADITLQASADASHLCRIEAWQDGQLVAQQDIAIESGEERKLDFNYPAGETLFRLYDGGTLALDDSGAELTLHLWVDVA